MCVGHRCPDDVSLTLALHLQTTGYLPSQLWAATSTDKEKRGRTEPHGAFCSPDVIRHLDEGMTTLDDIREGGFDQPV